MKNYKSGIWICNLILVLTFNIDANPNKINETERENLNDFEKEITKDLKSLPIFLNENEENNKNFYNAYFNSKEGDFENKSDIDEFEIESKKSLFNEIKKNKYIVTALNSSPDDELIQLGEYNFKKECFKVNDIGTGIPYLYRHNLQIGNSMYYVVPQRMHVITNLQNNFCLNISNEKAKDFKNEIMKVSWLLLIKIEKIHNKSPKNFCSSFDDEGNFHCKLNKLDKLKFRFFELKIVRILGIKDYEIVINQKL